MSKSLIYSIDGKTFSFSTKSITINNQEYLYKEITAIKHSSAKSLYLFKSGNEWHEVLYDEAHKSSVSTLFKRVAELAAKRASAKANIAKSINSTVTEEHNSQQDSEDAGSVKDANVAAVTPTADVESSSVNAEPVSSETPESEACDQTAEASDGTGESVADESDVVDAGDDVDDDVVRDKKNRLKKSIIVLIAVLVLFAALGVAYYFVFGLPNDTPINQPEEPTYQYNDIDELIEEMQE